MPSAWVFGIGFGQPYGGLGGQFQVRPWQPVALFAGGGYALAGLGYNVGMNLRLSPNSRVCPLITGMYGYNAAIAVRGLPEENQLYYGTSFGIGLEIHGLRQPRRYWSVQVIFPQRPTEYEDDLDALDKRPDVEILQRPWSFTVAVGYHFGQ
ncbi:MAG: hypothetical protein KF905_05180 [Flavobacteriales bacterium]|nr:hypothetical protein [Flavobacteriales bacterium]